MPQNTFGELVHHFRLRMGMTLAEFGQAVNMSPTNLSRIERGKVAPPPVAVMQKIAIALRVPFAQLLKAAGTDMDIEDSETTAIDLEQAILSYDRLDASEKAFLLEALRLLQRRRDAQSEIAKHDDFPQVRPADLEGD